MRPRSPHDLGTAVVAAASAQELALADDRRERCGELEAFAASDLLIVVPEDVTSLDAGAVVDTVEL